MQWLCAAVLAAVLAGGQAAHADSVVVEVRTAEAGRELAAGMVGLSYETSLLMPNEQGLRYFRPDNQKLVGMFKALGVKNLRIGGDSVDTATVPIPGEEDLRSLFEFARAAGVKVIYSVRLLNGEPAAAAKQARFIHEHYPEQLESFAIGNEPAYYKEWEQYAPRWVAIRDAIVAAAPQARFCGPDTNPSPALARRMAETFGNAEGRLVEITQHSYPFGCAYQNYRETDVTKLLPQDAAASREKMLSAEAYALYEPIRAAMANAVAGTPLTFRLSETNSYWFSGLAGASDRYAAALWGAEYLHWWAAHGAAGVNFHTGDQTGGKITLPCRYAAFVTAAAGYEVRPLAYGMKLFTLGANGRTVPVKLDAPGMAAYATLTADNQVLVTVFNKRHGEGAEAAEVRVTLDVPVRTAEGIALREARGDVAADAAAVTLGGSRIAEDGTWDGKWERMNVGAGREVGLRVLPASAVVIRIR